jgi:hypothetical protein
MEESLRGMDGMYTSSRGEKKEGYLRKALTLLVLICLVGAFSFAQEQGGIKGTVTDPEGNPLPGVTVTLTGSKTAPRSAVTSAMGNFRFLNLPVASDYTVKLELQGFKTVLREKQVITYGRDVTYDIKMEPATIAEEITVVGQTPVIDTKRTQVGVNVTSDEIMSLPTSRNPWVMMELAPGMMVDREDVGGSEAGQQSAYYGHGSANEDQTWNLDGANITDYSALGGAPAYLNLASYEELQINYGNNDVKSQTGGVQLNFVTKRGGKNFSGTFYLDAEDKNWQSSNFPSRLSDQGFKPPGINRVYLYGANFGGPIVKDHAWFFGSWGIRDLNINTISGVANNTWLESGYAKLDFQLSKNTRASGFLEYDSKIKTGRTAWRPSLQAPETLLDQTGPSYAVKGEVEQMFGNLFLNAKVVYDHAAFHLLPRLGARTAGFNTNPVMFGTYYPTEYHSGNIYDVGSVRPTFNVNLNGNMFVENVLRANHEIKFGVDYVQSTVSSFQLYPNNYEVVEYSPDWIEAWVHQDSYLNLAQKKYAAFAQDTMTWGKFSFNIGLRVDVQQSSVSNENVPACPLMTNYLGALKISSLTTPRLTTFSPRASLIYDLSGDGRNVLKLNLARYGSQLGYDLASFINPVGWREIDLRWVDLNHDGKVQQNELFGTDWANGSTPTVNPNDPAGWSWFGYFDPANPLSTTPFNKINSSYSSPILDELSVSFEREIITDFAARLEFFYKNYHNPAWNIGILPDGTLDSKANYYVAGHDATINKDYCGRFVTPTTSYRTNSSGQHTRYMAGELVLKKRLSNNWMMDASFTYMDWKYFYGGDYLNPSNVSYYDGGVNAPNNALTDVFVNSRWMGKLTGLCQFPYGINASLTFVAREGYVIPTYVRVNMPRIGSGQNLYGDVGGGGLFGDTRLPNFTELNFRLEKVFKIGEASKVVVAADAFNALNSNTALSVIGQITSSNFMLTQRILNPRVFRFGIRFTF